MKIFRDCRPLPLVMLMTYTPAAAWSLTSCIPVPVSTGTHYNRNRTYTLGFNLVGNPYPSPVDWTASGGWTKTNIDNAIYYFNAGTTDQYRGAYSSYINGVSSDGIANGIIPSMQGFFVHVSNGSYPVAGTLSVNNAARVTNLSPVFHKQTSGPDYPLVRISAGYEGDTLFSDPAVVYFDPGATPGFDQALDALKLFNTDSRVPSLYSVAASQKLAISAIPEPGGATTVIPLGIRTEQDGVVVFRARDLAQLPAGLHAYLTDAQTGDVRDLELQPVYRLSLGSGEHENRFSLVFSRQSGIHAPGTEPLLAYSKGSSVFVGLSTDRGVLQITNTLGQTVHREELTGTGMHEVRLQAAAGVYVISMTSGSGRQSRKIFIGNN